ncbi:MAG TPA: hypothetical protein VGH87_05580 [Polyangiaceae bacterium]
MGAATVGLLLDNVQAVLRAVATLPTSREARQLTDRALGCERAIQAWSTTPPDAVQRMGMHERVLLLYSDLSKLKRVGL